MFQFTTVEEAVKLIKSGDMIAFNNNGRCSFAEAFFPALEKRFLETGAPTDLSLLNSTSFATKGQPLLGNALAKKGLVKMVSFGHWQAMTEFVPLVVNNDIEAYNIPQGIVAQNYVHAARRVPGFLSRVGLHTFMDPRYGGGALNEISKQEFTKVVEVDGKEYLFYKTIYPDVAVIRGTTADPHGNITFEREGSIVDALPLAMAVKNNGGKVIVQVERLSGNFAKPKDVVVPGMLVDAIYTAYDENTWQTWMGHKYVPEFSGETRFPDSILPQVIENFEMMNMTSKRTVADRIIARRAALEIKKGDRINVGIGIPLMMGLESHMMGILDETITFTTEAGSVGGVPVGDYAFGMHVNPDCVYRQGDQFAFYEGRSMDITGIGIMEIDQHGHINSMRKGDKIMGVGGFNHTTYGAKKVMALTRMMAGSNIIMNNGVPTYVDGKVSKFSKDVEYINLNGDFARSEGQQVLYMTERALFRLHPEGGLELYEIGKNINLENDVLKHIPFPVRIAENLAVMPDICYDFSKTIK